MLYQRQIGAEDLLEIVSWWKKMEMEMELGKKKTKIRGC